MTTRSLVTVIAVTLSTIVTPTLAEENRPLTRQVYQAFQTGDLAGWDKVIAEDVVTNSSARFGTQGLDALKAWADEFLTAFAPRVDLVDEIDAVDENGDGRAVVTVNLNWTHVQPFFGLEPSGRTGTSIENLIMTVEDGKVTRIEVADTTLDLVIYMHERDWVFPQNIRPEPIVRGIERPTEQPPISLQ